MANRILIGQHGTYGYGAFVSKPGVDVTGANIEDFLFASTSVNQNQFLLLEKIPLTYGGSGTVTVTQDYANFNKDTQLVLVYFSSGSGTSAGSATNAWVGNTFGAMAGLMTITNTKVSTTVGRITVQVTGGGALTYSPTVGVLSLEV